MKLKSGGVTKVGDVLRDVTISNLNDLSTYDGIICTNLLNTANIQNAPTQSDGVLLQINWGGIVQIFFDGWSRPNIYYRMFWGSWSNWSRLH